MNKESLQNKIEPPEKLSADEAKISAMLGSLPEVSAPPDFDFRLKARIANAAPDDFQVSVWHRLRYILPLTATVLLAAFVFYQTGFFGVQTNPTIAEIQETPPVQTESAPAEIPPFADSNANNAEILTAENETANVSEPKEIQQTPILAEKKSSNNPKKLSTPDDDNSIISRDLAVKPNQPAIFPPGTNPQNAVPVINQTAPEKTISGNEIFKLIGIEAVEENEKIKVRSVKEKSLADLSGVKAGDFIEAIDEQRFDNKNSPPAFKGGKTITVSRGGKIMKITLKPN